MAISLEELEKRLAALEQEVARLRDKREPPRDETPVECGARMIREAEANQAAWVEAWKQLLERQGIRGEPIGAEKVQEMMAACGVKPEDNLLSRGIIEMREE
jgi:3-methyladenine DNA glycosylase/8-oxoguanine DNA glycosylase